MTRSQACVTILDDVIDSLRKRKSKFEAMAEAAKLVNKDITHAYCEGRSHALGETINTLTNTNHLIRIGRI